MSAARLEMLETENELLREHIARLERDFMGAHLVMPPEWMLTWSEQRVLAVLLARPMATKEQILTSVYREFARDEPEPKIVDVFICKLQRKMSPHGLRIATDWGLGWRIDEPQRGEFLRQVTPVGPKEGRAAA